VRTFATDEACQRRRQIRSQRFARADRRKFHAQIGDDELIETFGAGESAQPVIAEVAQRGVGRRLRVEQRDSRGRQQDLLAVRGGHDARCASQCGAAKDLVVGGFRGTRMEAHPDANRCAVPVFACQRPLG
jgi:hypothetical protein